MALIRDVFVEFLPDVPAFAEHDVPNIRRDFLRLIRTHLEMVYVVKLIIACSGMENTGSMIGNLIPRDRAPACRQP